jgi:hypothetical protein
VQQGNQVGAIVHRNHRLVIQGRAKMAIVRFVIFSLDGVDGYLVVLYQRRRDIVLRGKRIGRAQDDIRATGFQSLNQIGGLRGDMKASGKTHAPERLLFAETLAHAL